MEEEWRVIDGFRDYEASSLGRIRRVCLIGRTTHAAF